MDNIKLLSDKELDDLDIKNLTLYLQILNELELNDSNSEEIEVI